jgi:hypothetical protein
MRVVRPQRTCFAQALRVMACGAAALLAACSTSHPAPPGTPVVTMSNLTNSGDFISYIININAIELTRSDGSIVRALATRVTADLALLNSGTELVAAPAVPEGTYTSALIALDWTLGSGTTQPLWLNVHGQPLEAVPINVSGTGMTTASVIVTFDPSHPLVIKHNQSVRLKVEVDLLASNQRSDTATGAEVVVQPFAVIRPAPADATVMRLRGLFVTTQDVASGFYMNSRPFYNLSSALGAVIVNTNAQTYFNINGVVYTGSAGLAVIAQQLQNTPLAAYGTLDNLSGVTPTFNATEIYFGTAQESQLAYYATGTITARSNNTLTLRGADYVTPLPTPAAPTLTAYINSVAVTLGSGTPVYEDGRATPGLTIAGISVGQQITVAGQPQYDSAGTLTGIDATLGLVRLRPTTLWGTQNADATLDLASLGPFASAAMNFAGTGLSGHEAAPGAYVVDTSAVPPGPVTTTGELLQMQGTVAPFGAAPPDFAARAATPGPNSLQTLVVDFVTGGSAAPFTSISSSGLVVNLANPDLGTTHEIRTGPASLDLKSLPASPLITTTGADPSQLQLAIGSTQLAKGISVYNSATAFASAVTSAFNGSNKIFRLVAYGQYDTASNTFVASRIHVALHE